MTDEIPEASRPPNDANGPPPGMPPRALQAVLADDFAQYGTDAVKALRVERPHDYLKLVASFAPKDPPPANPTVEDMTDDEFIRVLNVLRSRAPAGGSAPDEDAGG